MPDGYFRRRCQYADISGSLVVASGTGDTTLVTVRANYTIFIQTAKLQVTGASATTWSLEDAAGVSITGALSTSTAPVSYEEDYGAEGVALTAGSNFVLNVGAAGASGQITWTGYMKLTSVINLTTASTAN